MNEQLLRVKIMTVIKNYRTDPNNLEGSAERIMELFRNEEKKGGEQGSLHRVVGATVGADGLLACPCCGGKPELIQWTDTERPNATWIECDCGLLTDSVYGEPPEEARKIARDIWNKRQAPENTPATGSEHRGPNAKLSNGDKNHG